MRLQRPPFCQLNYPGVGGAHGSGVVGGGWSRHPASSWAALGGTTRVSALMGSLIKKRRKRMRKKKHKKMLKATRWQRRAGK